MIFLQQKDHLRVQMVKTILSAMSTHRHLNLPIILKPRIPGIEIYENVVLLRVRLQEAEENNSGI